MADCSSPIFLRGAQPIRRNCSPRDPVGGPAKRDALLRVIDEAALILCAWGAFSAATRRGNAAIALVHARGRVAHCLGLTKSGAPRHPLYLPNTARPIPLAGAMMFPSMKGARRPGAT